MKAMSMGNRAVITLENQKGHHHPVGLYVHWNGGLESVLAFITHTWDTFERGRDDVYTFHARLCQVLANFFPDGLSLYGIELDKVDDWIEGADNGRFHFRITKDGATLLFRASEIDAAKRHHYWTNTPNIFDTIKRAMPTKDEKYQAVGGKWNDQGEAVA
jgi:hypothetical protein